MNIVLVILTFCLFSSAVFAHNDGHGEMCQQLSYLSDLYNQKIDQKIARETDARLKEMNENYHKLEQQLNSTKASLHTAEEKLDNLIEKFSQMEQKPTPTASVVNVSNCDVKYNGKCFRAIVHDTQNVNFAAAETMCDNGWKLANIYSRQHYDIVVEYLRTKLAPISLMTVWLGMTYDANANQMYSSDGTLFTKELPWFPGYPSRARSYNHMNIYVRVSTSEKQGVVNLSAKHRRRGVLCEI